MSDVCEVANASLLANAALITDSSTLSDASKVTVCSFYHRKIKISIYLTLSKIAALSGGRIFDAVVSDPLTLKTLTLTDCNRR